MSLSSETVQTSDETYCICKGNWNNKFMIGCDNCDGWYHGSCININSEQAKQMEKYYCPLCVAKDSTLKPVYKAKYKEDKERKEKDRTKEKNRAKDTKQRNKSIIESDDSDSDSKLKKKYDKPEHKGGSKIPKVEGKIHKVSKVEGKLHKASKMEAKRPEIKLVKMKEAKVALNATEKTHSPPQMVEVNKKEVKVEKEEKKATIIEESESDDEQDFQTFLSSIASKITHKKYSSSEDELVDVGTEEAIKPEVLRVLPVPKRTKSDIIKKSKPRKKNPNKKLPKSSSKNSEKVKELVESEEEEKQCLGPGCCKAARSKSRYCSDECGIELAKKRIKTFLPERKTYMLKRGFTDECDEKLIEEMEAQQQVAHQRVEDLQNKRVVVMSLISKAKGVTFEEGENEDDVSDEEAENELIDCVTCGMACSNKNAIKHMERCYSKFEAQLSLGSTVKCDTAWENPVCDTYDRQQGAYCKKLRVLCPDHNREKEEHSGICGCPLEFSSVTEDSPVCVRSKKSCTKHVSWEKLLLAEIDMERVHQCLKLEDSFENMRKVKYRIMNRRNVLQILLNGTIHHDKDISLANIVKSST